MTSALLCFLLSLSGVPVPRGEDLPSVFEQQLGEAMAGRDAPALRRLLPFFTESEVAAALDAGRAEPHVVQRTLGVVGQGTLVFLLIERAALGETQTLFQSLCELHSSASGPVAVRRVPVAEAARAFRLAAHQSTLRIEADTGATEMLDEIEIAVLRPTRWIFFFLDPTHEVRTVKIETASAEIFRASNFVALERQPQDTAWATGERVRVRVRSRLRFSPRRAA